jgi:hypothetical protein
MPVSFLFFCLCGLILITSSGAFIAAHSASFLTPIQSSNNEYNTNKRNNFKRQLIQGKPHSTKDSLVCHATGPKQNGEIMELDEQTELNNENAVEAYKEANLMKSYMILGTYMYIYAYTYVYICI